MKRLLSERNLVVILFVAALTVFSFAQEDADKIEKMSQEAKVSSILPSPVPTAENRQLIAQPTTASSVRK